MKILANSSVQLTGSLLLEELINCFSLIFSSETPPLNGSGFTSVDANSLSITNKQTPKMLTSQGSLQKVKMSGSYFTAAKRKENEEAILLVIAEYEATKILSIGWT